MNVTIDGVDTVDGTIVAMTATDQEGRHILVAVDRRPACDIACAIDAEGPVSAYVEPWQIMGWAR
jgi:hypothetical protein